MTSLIRDFFGRPVAKKPDPATLRGEAIVHRVRDRARASDALSGEMTPEKIRRIFAEADAGLIGPQIELAQVMEERDEHLRAALEVRRLAPLAVDWQVQPGAADAAARKAADAFREAWRRLSDQNILERLQYAILPQWHIERVIWENDGRSWTPRAIEEVDARKLAWPMTAPETPGDDTAVVPGLMDDQWNPAHLLPIGAGTHLVHAYRARRGRPGMMALVRSCAFLWMLKRYAWIDFGTLLEQFGKPWRAVKYDPTATRESIRELLIVLREAASDLAIALPKGSELELEPGMTSVAHLPHTDMVKLVNEAFSKLVVGSTTITDAAGNSESVSSPTHAGVRRDLRDADCLALAATINRDLAAPFALWNYGDDVAPPRLVPTLAERQDPQKRAAVYEAAARLGLTVVTRQVYEDLGLQQPEGIEETMRLTPPAPAMAGLNWGAWAADAGGRDG